MNQVQGYVDEAAWWLVTMERTHQVHVLAEVASKLRSNSRLLTFDF